MNWLPDISPGLLAALVLAGLLAGLSRGFSGFGAALIFVPLASMLVGPKLAGPILAIIDAIFAAYLIPAALRLAQRRSVATMFAGALFGIPAGAWILTLYSPHTLRWMICVMAALMFVLVASGWRYRGMPHVAATLGVGALSGVFSGIAQIGGPPVVSYWLGTETPPAVLRANVIVYFAASTVLTLVVYGVGGLFTPAALKLAACSGPAYGLGTVVGNRMFALATPGVFRRITLALIALAVLLSLPWWTGG